MEELRLSYIAAQLEWCAEQLRWKGREALPIVRQVLEETLKKIMQLEKTG